MITGVRGWRRRGGGVIERWIPSCDVWLLLYSTVDIPEVMEHEWVHRLHANGEWTKKWVHAFTVPKVEHSGSIKQWGITLLSLVPGNRSLHHFQWPVTMTQPELARIQSRCNGLGRVSLYWSVWCLNGPVDMLSALISNGNTIIVGEKNVSWHEMEMWSATKNYRYR